MCFTAPARVLEVDEAGATIELEGARRRAATLVVPDVRPGDWVLVGAGTILRRLEPAEARDLAGTIESAIAADKDATTRRPAPAPHTTAPPSGGTP